MIENKITISSTDRYNFCFNCRFAPVIKKINILKRFQGVYNNIAQWTVVQYVIKLKLNYTLKGSSKGSLFIFRDILY